MPSNIPIARTHLDKPHLSFYRDGSLLEVGSDKAAYNIQNKKVVFRTECRLKQSGRCQRLAGIVKTERLNVDTEAQYAYTDSPVTFQYGQSGGQANGMTYDHKTGLLNFPSKVKATIYDTKICKTLFPCCRFCRQPGFCPAKTATSDSNRSRPRLA